MNQVISATRNFVLKTKRGAIETNEKFQNASIKSPHGDISSGQKIVTFQNFIFFITNLFGILHEGKQENERWIVGQSGNGSGRNHMNISKFIFETKLWICTLNAKLNKLLCAYFPVMLSHNSIGTLNVTW